jgi:hypothetical protein
MLDPSNEDKATLTTMDFYIAIYKNMIRYIFLDSEFNYTNNVEHIDQCCDKLKQLVDEFNKVRNKKNHSECIYLFTNLLVDKQIKLLTFFNLILEFTKRLQSRKKIDEQSVRKNMLLELDLDELNSSLVLDVIFA